MQARHPRRRAGRARTSPPTSRTIDGDPAAAAEGRARRCSRCGARSTCRWPRSRRSTSARPRPASGSSSTPATRRPARCARRTRRSPPAASCRSGRYQLGEVEGGPAFTQPPRDARLPAVGSACRSTPRSRVLRHLDEVYAFCERWQRAPPRPRLRDRRRGREGRRPRAGATSSAPRARRPGGRSPTSSRPRSAPPSCSTSWCRSAAPGGPRRSPARAGVRRRRDRRPGDAAQRGPGAGQGRAPGRHRHRAQGGRRHPRGRRPGAGRAARRACKPWAFPTDVPVCGEPLVRLEGESDTFCVNLDCPASGPARIEHFASRGAMDIEGLGEQRGPAVPRARPPRTTSATSTRSTGTSVRALEGFGEISVAQPASAPSRRRRTGRSPTCSSASTSATSARPAPSALARAFGHLDRDHGRRRSTSIAAVDGVGPIIAAERARVLRRRRPTAPSSRSCGPPA